MAFRIRNTRCEGHHDDEKYSFKSRHVDKALLEAAFYRRFGRRMPQTYNHPLRYWAIAGWGPVPAALRAPEGIYRELGLADPSDLEQKIQTSDWPLWYERHHHHQNIIFNYHFENLIVGEVKCVAFIDARDNTTVENFRIRPEGTEAVVCLPEELQTIRPPIDTATGREYIEMTTGDFVVSDGDLCIMKRVGNAAVGKWFWKLHPRRDESLVSQQLVVWHKSVDDADEYKSPYQGSEDDVIEVYKSAGHCWDSDCDSPNFDFFFKERKKASAVVETFLWTADAEPQLKHAMAQFMTEDPNGLWWKRGELPDGFLLSSPVWEPHNPPLNISVGELRCEKLFFMNDEGVLFNSIRAGVARAIMGRCVVRVPDDERFLSIQFKPSRATGKIVAMRAVFVDENFYADDDSDFVEHDDGPFDFGSDSS